MGIKGFREVRTAEVGSFLGVNNFGEPELLQVSD